MEQTLYAKLLAGDCFLLPTVNEISMDTVLELIHDRKTPPLQAIVCEIAALSYQIQADYYFDYELYNLSLGLNADKVADYMTGFRTPLVVIFSCFFANTLLFDRNVEPKNTHQYIRTARRKSLRLVNNCTPDNIASVATRIFTHCEEDPFIDNEYYRVGVTASLTTFREFIDPDLFTPPYEGE